MTRFGVLALAAMILPAPPAGAQNYDILEAAPRTSVIVETDYTANGDRPECDWYVPADDYLAAERAGGFARDCVITLRIRGVINRDGAFLFSDVVKRAESSGHPVSTLVLDSKGGDADAAISMGQLIRASDIFRTIPVVAKVAEGYQSVCFSACVVIFSAAYEKALEFDINGDPELPSRIGIHGPGQFDRESSSYASSAANSEIMRVNRRLKEYFASIGVSERLVDDMYAVPFDEIRLLSRSELIGYGLYAD